MSKQVYMEAPALSQFSDETLLLEIGELVFEGFIDREPNKNGLRLCVSGHYKDLEPIDAATNKYQILLGALRAWKTIAGERKDEVRPGIGSSPIQDENGNQVIRVGGVKDYCVSQTETKKYASHVKIAIESSQPLKNALWLFGRRDRNAADFYMIYEYAKQSFEGDKQLSESLGISKAVLKNLCQSINNLCPTKGGRHSGCKQTPRMEFVEQMELTAFLLRNWIAFVGNQRNNYDSDPD